MAHKTFCFAIFLYYYIPLFFTVSTQNSFTKIKSVLRFLAVCRTVLGGRNAHDGFENTVKMIDIIEAAGVADVQHTVVCLREHFHGLTDTLFVQIFDKGLPGERFKKIAEIRLRKQGAAWMRTTMTVSHTSF